jgi:hypothetical protein
MPTGAKHEAKKVRVVRVDVELSCGKSFMSAARIRDDSVGWALRPLNYEHASLAIINRRGPSHASATSRR